MIRPLYAMMTGLFVIASLTAFGQQQTKAVPKVVFVCEHGAAKSVMAASELQRMAKERGLEVTVLSRGSNPDAEIAAGVRKELEAAGMVLGSAKPAKVSAQDLTGATRVISFGPDLSTFLPKGAKALDWSATPAPSQDYKAAREHILKQLEALLADLPK